MNLILQKQLDVVDDNMKRHNPKDIDMRNIKERSEKDKINLLKDHQKTAENVLKKNLLEPQVEAIFNKYGMTCDLAENRVYWDPNKLNNILYEYLSDNLIKELKEFGIEAKLNDMLVNDNWALLTPIYKRHFKVNLNMKENEDGI